MNTRMLAEKYRLSYWAKIMDERKESGLSINNRSRRRAWYRV
jgi:hypothetical protein